MFINSTNRHEQAQRQENDADHLENVERALSDVYRLLELYAPSWYSEALRERVRSALYPTNGAK